MQYFIIHFTSCERNETMLCNSCEWIFCVYLLCNLNVTKFVCFLTTFLRSIDKYERRLNYSMEISNKTLSVLFKCSIMAHLIRKAWAKYFLERNTSRKSIHFRQNGLIPSLDKELCTLLQHVLFLRGVCNHNHDRSEAKITDNFS